nr:DNA topoisomerase [Staphylococcus lugdunensis]
ITHKKNGYIENEKYIVTWALGHLVTNAQPEHYDKRYQTWNLNDLPIIPKHMKTIVIGKTSKQFKTVKSLLLNKQVNNVIIATDAGREGELVARLILDKVGNKKPIQRLWISSVTKKAIQQGFKNLQDGRKYNHLYQAALARSEADWIVGINATRALTTKYDAQLSLGRVQTPTIQLVYERQKEIKQFKPEDYYTLHIKVAGYEFDLDSQQRFKQREDLEHIVKAIAQNNIQVTTVETKRKKSYPQALFNLTDLQQEAYRRFKMGPKETLNTLQNLYERHKLVTYPRTDSNFLTSDMVETFSERLQALLATDYKVAVKNLMKKSFNTKLNIINDKKVSDHHAIIPTEIRPDLNQLTAREQKIYMLVAERFIASLM